MESVSELIPLAREVLGGRPSRGLLKVYMVGSVLAVMGTVLGLVETVCQPFSSGEPLDAEMLLMLARESGGVEARALCGLTEEEREEETLSSPPITFPKKQTAFQRPLSNRLHAT